MIKQEVKYDNNFNIISFKEFYNDDLIYEERYNTNNHLKYLLKQNIVFKIRRYKNKIIMTYKKPICETPLKFIHTLKNGILTKSIYSNNKVEGTIVDSRYFNSLDEVSLLITFELLNI